MMIHKCTQLHDNEIISLIQDFEADFLWIQSQNPEFRINPENFHICMIRL